MAQKVVGVLLCGYYFTDGCCLGVGGIVMSDTEDEAVAAYERWKNHEREDTDFRVLGTYGAQLLQWVKGVYLAILVATVIGVLYWLIF
jgi:hypothetical protein